MELCRNILLSPKVACFVMPAIIILYFILSPDKRDRKRETLLIRFPREVSSIAVKNFCAPEYILII